MQISLIIPHWPYGEEINSRMIETCKSLVEERYRLPLTDFLNETIEIYERSRKIFGAQSTVRSFNVDGDIEIVLSVNNRLGFATGVNNGIDKSIGEFIMIINNDLSLEHGSLKDLCIDGVVTSPIVNGVVQDFWGSFYCIPREVFKQIGGLSVDYGLGYFEDDDYIERLKEKGIEMRCIENVKVNHAGGKTMEALGDRVKIFEENKKTFNKKWK